MFCSTIIPTVGRNTLTQAVNSLLTQTFSVAGLVASEQLEVIIVNDSGRTLPMADWGNSPQVRVIETQRRERSFARNTGAALACGRYLHFLDDDDWLLPNAMQQFWQLAQTSAAGWLYGDTELLDLKRDKRVTLQFGGTGNCFVQMITGEWVPIQSSLIAADCFFACGGFNPLATPGEDKDLLGRFALHYDFAYTGGTVAVIRREGESTTDYAKGRNALLRQREQILNQSNAFQRMRQSINAPYWHGRAIRTYWASALWNVRQRHWLPALSRTLHGLALTPLAGAAVTNGEFWQAMSQPHISRVVQDE